jgi:putative DNA primase/helicase
MGTSDSESLGQEDDPHLTDLGNAKRVLARHGQDIRYCFPWKQFLVWDKDGYWAGDQTGEAVRRVKETQAAFYSSLTEQLEAAGAVEGPERKDHLAAAKRFLSHALDWEDARAIDRCLKLMTSEPGVPVLPEDLDAAPFLLNVLNGTLDLQTGKLRAQRREDLITRICPVGYVTDSACALWDKFLSRIFDGNRDLIGYLQRVIGYSLTGDVSEQSLWFFHGTGANGKSTFLGTILALLGPYAMQAVSELLMAKHNESHPTERADLFGKRFVATIETDQGRRMAEALMKQLTGGDKIRARKMHKDFFEFEPTFKLFLAANHKPAVRGRDHAVWRRIKLVPFTVTISDEEKDKDLPNKLKAELPGILRWAVEGCLTWQKYGLGEPDEVRQATSAYRAEQDTIATFIAECCFVSSEVKVRSSLLWHAYQEWSGDKEMSQIVFTNEMNARGYPSQTGHANRKFYRGIGLPNGGTGDRYGAHGGDG